MFQRFKKGTIGIINCDKCHERDKIDLSIMSHHWLCCGQPVKIKVLESSSI